MAPTHVQPQVFPFHEPPPAGAFSPGCGGEGGLASEAGAGYATRRLSKFRSLIWEFRVQKS